MSGFDPNSTDAMFAKILQRMDTQDDSLRRIEAGVVKTNGRVTSLEQDRWYQRGIVAAIGVGVTMTVQWLKTK